MYLGRRQQCMRPGYTFPQGLSACNSCTIRQGGVTCDVDAGALTYRAADKDAASKRWVHWVRDIVLIDVASQPVQPHSHAILEDCCPTCRAKFSGNVPSRSLFNYLFLENTPSSNSALGAVQSAAQASALLRRLPPVGKEEVFVVQTDQNVCASQISTPSARQPRLGSRPGVIVCVTCLQSSSAAAECVMRCDAMERSGQGHL